MTRRITRSHYGTVVPAAALSLALLGGCTKDPPNPGGGDMAQIPMPGDNFVATTATTSGDFAQPLDTVPTSDSATFYFTAMDASGFGVFKSPAGGGAATKLVTGAPFVSPFGIAISSDDKTLYIADTAAGHAVNDPNATDKPGRIFSLSTGGGVPMPLSGTEGTQPKGLEVVSEGGSDMIYYTGVDANDGMGALFKMPASGGTPTTVVKGGPLTDPAGVAVTKSGDVYVLNTAGEEGAMASIIKISGGTASEFKGGLSVGYPAGIAVDLAGTTLFVSGQNREKHSSVVYRISLSNKDDVKAYDQGISMNLDSGGLHRARSLNVFSWAGPTAGATGGGLVYRVELK